MANRNKQKNIILPLLLVTMFIGCATLPQREGLAIYNLNGTMYAPLIPFCELRGINLEYDQYTRAVTLNNGLHRVNLMVGQTLVLVDGKPEHLRHPIDIYQGTLVMPYKFKDELDILFKGIPSAPEAALSLSPVKKIVIDAGHGGNDPGAIGKTGLREKVVTLDLSKRLGNLLRAEGFEVVMTRSTDTFIPLSRRVQIANNSGADLFLSIHANANRVKALNGFEVYYISPDTDMDLRRAADAARDNAHLNFDSSCFASPSLDLRTILWDMTHTRDRAESVKLARSICRVMDNDLNARIIGVKSANFYVLKGTRMPAVLVEVGFVSNYDEERRLKNGFYRQQIAEAIKQGVEDYARELLLAQVNSNE